MKKNEFYTYQAWYRYQNFLEKQQTEFSNKFPPPSWLPVYENIFSPVLDTTIPQIKNNIYNHLKYKP